MIFELYFIVFLFGLVFGSFFNVCISRIPAKESLLTPSHCPKCHRAIKLYGNIPVLSYLFLRGRCRHCKEKISFQYPLVELLTAAVFTLLFYSFGMTLLFVKYAVVASLLIIISFIDMKTQEIPDGLVVFGLITGLLFTLPYHFKAAIFDGFLGFLLGGGFFLLIAVASRGGMGGGDIKLMAVLGLWFGWKSILMISLLSFVIGAFVSLLLLTTRIKSRKDSIPFGPFIALGAMLVILCGNDLLAWYMKMFF
jgi:leader peptidase (prepilin peptidase)/N-methyltransferase